MVTCKMMEDFTIESNQHTSVATLILLRPSVHNYVRSLWVLSIHFILAK